MTKVFIPNKAGHDFEPAKRYGELVYISEGYQDKHATNTMQRQWQVALADSSPNDIIMMAGLSNMQAIGCGMLALMHGRVNLLIYDPETKRKMMAEGKTFRNKVVITFKEAVHILKFTILILVVLAYMLPKVILCRGTFCPACVSA